MYLLTISVRFLNLNWIKSWSAKLKSAINLPNYQCLKWWQLRWHFTIQDLKILRDFKSAMFKSISEICFQIQLVIIEWLSFVQQVCFTCLPIWKVLVWEILRELVLLIRLRYECFLTEESMNTKHSKILRKVVNVR